MNESANASEEIKTQSGLIGFFDVLGFTNIVKNNEIKEAALVVKKILEKARRSQDANNIIEKLLPGHKFCEHVLFSDSIVVYSSFDSFRDEGTSTAMFSSFCAGLITELFWAGLPIRGALAAGDYYVENHVGSVCLAGKPIVEAYEISELLDFAGCVVAPSAEKLFRRALEFFEYSVPLKGCQKQKMLVLNNYVTHWHERELSRPIIMENFGAFNKRVGIEVLPKINNTLNFLEECKRPIYLLMLSRSNQLTRCRKTGRAWQVWHSS